MAAKKKPARKRATKRAAPRKAATKRAAPKKRKITTRTGLRAELKSKGKKLAHGYDVSNRSITGIMSEGKQILVKQIGQLEAKKFTTRLKRDKNKIAKQIREKKTQYRKLS